MKNNVVFSGFFLGIVLFIAVLGTACKSSDKEADNNTDTLVTDTETSNPENQFPELYSIPAKLSVENGRDMIDDTMLQIMLVESNIPVGKQQELISQLFVNSTVTPADKAEEFEAYNISYNNKNYHVVVLFEQNENEENILGFFIISEGNFTPDTIGKIFN